MEEITKADVVEYLKRKAEEFHYKGKFTLSKLFESSIDNEEFLDFIVEQATKMQKSFFTENDKEITKYSRNEDFIVIAIREEWAF